MQMTQFSALPTEIYLDNAATTPIDERVKKAMEPYFSKLCGNPSSIHATGIRAQKALEQARTTVARVLSCDPTEIIFTSGGTESINLALQGIARANKHSRKHIITTSIEHPAVLQTCDYLQKNEGFEITYLDVDNYGSIKLEQLKQSIRDDTLLITIQYANNEIGTIQPIAEIGKIARQHGIYFHTDACQAGTLLDLDVNKLNVDLLTLNGSKISAPAGTGILYVNKKVQIAPLLFDGGQEHGIRSGT